MNIKDILAKIAKKETLTDEELQFLTTFDFQKELDKASAAARREGEKKASEAASKHGELTKQIEELQAKLAEKEEKGKTDATELDKLAKKIKTLEDKYAASEAKLAQSNRLNSIREAAKGAGIIAAEGISEKSLESLLVAAFGDTALDDEDSVKGILEQFKKDNPAMIRAAVKGGANVKGKQTDSQFAGKPNPWKEETKNLTLQIEMETKNPELAAQMKAEAGITE